MQRIVNFLFNGKRLSLGWWLVIIAGSLLLLIYLVLSRDVRNNLYIEAGQQMNRLQNSLDATLGKHAYLPALLATTQGSGDIAIGSSSDPARLEGYNRQLEKLSGISDTLDIYLMSPDGTTLASSNWNKTNTFIGQNFSFRPYFRQAIEGGPGRYYALGTTSGERGYYFSHPVRGQANEIVGVIVVKVDIKAIESNWNYEDAEFMITDDNGIVFMSSREQWRIRSIYPLSEATLAGVHGGRRYADKAIRPIPDMAHKPIDQFTSDTRFRENHYLHLHRDMPGENWRLHVLVDKKIPYQNLYRTFLLSSIVVLLSCLLVFLLMRNQSQRRRYEQQARQELREQVESRTRELKLAQEELVQAAKMAALGELSAGINHELNNPLTAIRSYASNAIRLLENGQLDIVKSNLSEIQNLTETMAAIARQLKTFGRKSQGNIESIEITQALDSAILIIHPKLNRENVELVRPQSIEPVMIRADLVWLEQIIVNLLNNAIQAVSGRTERRVFLSTSSTDGEVSLSIRDSGPGIDESHLPQVFEAFFTTKDAGKGLGLGLSISYRLAKDMQGRLSACNSPEGGAEFTLVLPRAK